MEFAVKVNIGQLSKAFEIRLEVKITTPFLILINMGKKKEFNYTVKPIYLPFNF